MSNKIVIICGALLIIGLNSFSLTTANTNTTAGELIATADSMAFSLASDAKLLLVQSNDVDTSGKAASWNYVYSSIHSMKEFYFHTNNDSVIYDSSGAIRVGISPVDSNWIDSDSAFFLAELNGGYDFRMLYGKIEINATLYRPVYPPFHTYWKIQYISSNSAIIITINAVSGEIITSVDDNLDRKKITRSFELLQSYPNPFNSYTTIRFYLPQSNFISLKIYNLVGQEIETVLCDYFSAGEYKMGWRAKDLPGGLYIGVLQVGDKVQTIKLALVK